MTNEPDSNFPGANQEDIALENPETTRWSILREIDIDPLTQLPNKKKGQEILERIISREAHSGEKLGLVFLDLDHFSDINEKYDHPFGNTVIKDCFDAVNDSFRPTDTLFRYAGDEGCVICPNMNAKRHEDMEKDIKFKIQKRLMSRSDFISHPEMSKIGITVGLVFWDGKESAEELINRADKVMNDRKREKHKQDSY